VRAILELFLHILFKNLVGDLHYEIVFPYLGLRPALFFIDNLVASE
jgi:hypothetical protein